MSFASETKSELCALYTKKTCCRRSLLLGILRSAYIFSDREIQFTTHHRQVAALTVSLLAEFYNITVQLPAADAETETETVYTVSLFGDDAGKIREQFETKEDGFPSALPIQKKSCEACGVCFIRGVFLSCGNITSPASCYHLDIALSEDSMAEEFGVFLEQYGFAPKHTARKGMPVLYCKESEAIEDFLAFMGANKAVFSLMNEKIRKDIRNNSNRVSNCELANIGKAVSAATIQYEAVRLLYEEDRFSMLSVELQQTANLRYENPDLPLKDLALLHEPPLTKSGLNHRLQKIVDFAANGNGEAEKEEKA